MQSTSRPFHVVVGVTGCIAAYKACELVRQLQKAGAAVRVVMTKAACEFVGPKTFEALCHNEVSLDLFEYASSPIPHIDYADWADVVVLAPCTANTMAKVAYGIADNALSSTVLACTCPCVIAPAMNVHMWQNAATQANVELLKQRGYIFVDPSEGHLACGYTGAGKLAPVEVICDTVMNTLRISSCSGEAQDSCCEGSLKGRKVVITAGPTREYIDPVRFLTNPSTGKMGYAIARAAANAGARVVLVSGPTNLDVPSGVERIDVISADQMYEETLNQCKDADVCICTAAVSDYTPKHPSATKIKKHETKMDCLELERTQDILQSVCSSIKPGCVVVGFAAETNNVTEYATEKLKRKGCDFIVANDVSKAQSTFGSDTNEVILVTANEAEKLPCMTKDEVAQALIDRIAKMVAQHLS